MADAAISFAIGKLGDFVIQQVNIRIGVRDDVKWLGDELGYLQASVRAAESRQEDEQIRNWVKNVREVADDAVTILQGFNIHQERQARLEHGILHRMRTCICMWKKEAKLLDIGNEIESLRERIVVIKGRRSEYGIDNILAAPNVRQKRRTLLRTTALDNQVDVIGFEDDIKTLMAELNSEDPSLKVISIHGMGGLGKTSLATKLYNSSELRHFDIRAKVCVSSDYDVKDVLKRIIKSFMGPEHEQNMSNMDEHDLLQYLSQLLQNRGRYFVLIDDIWELEAWEQIKIAFPNQKNGSRIIITTRKKKVAETVDDKCFVHQLRFLTEDESWQLFRKRAEPTNQNMEKLGKEIVGKCGGLPLAIVVLSGLLLHNQSYGYWLKVKEHFWRHVKQHDSADQIEEILSLSYNDLSLQMRNCFLYLARYPEDHSIYAIQVKLLWIAEEFISEGDEGGGVVLEDLADDYLNELINRNLIQVVFMRLDGEVSHCRVHDLVRDLAIKKAEELMSLVIFDSSKQRDNQIHMLKGQSRHVIYNEIGEYLNLLEEHRFDASNIRSLELVNYLSIIKVELKEMKLMYRRFKNLTVLDMTSVVTDEIPEEIGDLILLKYLGLAHSTDLSKPMVIPASIGKLKSLQTLRGTDNKYVFPEETCELHELRCLDIGFVGSLNIGRHQTKLHTLKYIRYKQWAAIDSVNFTNLRTLSLVDDGKKEGNDYTLESIANLTSLQTLSLGFYSTGIPPMGPLSSCNRLTSVELGGRIRDPSELSCLPHSLTYLFLLYSKFTEDPTPTLGNLFNLTALELKGAYHGNKMVFSQNAFPSLQILRLYSLSCLEELQVEDGALPRLKTFQIKRCERLNEIPIQLEQFRKIYY